MSATHSLQDFRPEAAPSRIRLVWLLAGTAVASALSASLATVAFDRLLEADAPPRLAPVSSLVSVPSYAGDPSVPDAATALRRQVASPEEAAPTF